MLVNKLDYLYRTLVVKSREQHNEVVDISDDDYEKYYNAESGQDNPIPGSDIPIPGEDENEHDYSKDYLTFEALEDGTFSFTGNSLYYSLDNGNTWNILYDGTSTPVIKAGNKIIWKQNNLKSSEVHASDERTGIGSFSSTCKFNISGNIISLLYGNNFNKQKELIGKNYIFSYLFYGCENLINAKNLILPSIILSKCCYQDMFCGCTSLTTAPELPATTLINGCYSYMFTDCSSLNYIKCLAVNINAENCLNNWVYNVSLTGTFIKLQGVDYNTLPPGWTIQELDPDTGEIVNEFKNKQLSLEGTWEGNTYISSTYNGLTYQSTYTQFDFMGDPYSCSSGRGIWVDYYSNAPWDYVANHIDWTVHDRVIYIHFIEENVNMEIYNYRLSNNHFRGYLRNGDNVMGFNMVHTSSINLSSYKYG